MLMFKCLFIGFDIFNNFPAELLLNMATFEYGFSGQQHDGCSKTIGQY